jgi:hypothetical protein
MISWYWVATLLLVGELAGVLIVCWFAFMCYSLLEMLPSLAKRSEWSDVLRIVFLLMLIGLIAGFIINAMYQAPIDLLKEY